MPCATSDNGYFHFQWLPQLCFAPRRPDALLITPPEVTNTGPGVNRGSGDGARGCGFEEQVGVHVRTGGGSFPKAILSVCLSVRFAKMTV